MAIHQNRIPPTRFTDSRRSDVTYNNNLTAPTDFAGNETLRSALQTADPNTYTDEVLDSMNVNDMIFAQRSIKNPLSISDETTAQEARP